MIYNFFDQWKLDLNNSDVICQWDPEKDIDGNNLTRRTIQLGLRKSILMKYADEWIVNITDITC